MKKFKNKFLVLIATLCLAIGATFGTGLAVKHPVYAADALWAGNGTSGSPYKIANYNDWHNFVLEADSSSTKFEETYFKLTANITITNVSDTLKMFSGVLDGNNKTITMNISNQKCGAEYRFGLVNQLQNSGIIKNLKTAGSINVQTQTRTTQVAVLCGLNYGLIKDCSNTADIYESSTNPYNMIAGLVATNCGDIENCSSSGIVGAADPSSGYKNVAEFCQENTGNIIGCSSNGDVTYTYDQASVIRSNTGYIADCKQTNSSIPFVLKNGYTNDTVHSLGEIENCSSVGALVVNNVLDGVITHSHSETVLVDGNNEGKIVDSFAGNIADPTEGEQLVTGENKGIIYNSFAPTLVASNSGTIKNCFSNNPLEAANQTGTVENLFYIGATDPSYAGTAEATAASVVNKLNAFIGTNVDIANSWYKWQVDGSTPTLSDEQFEISKVTPTIVSKPYDGCKLDYYANGKTLVISRREEADGKIYDKNAYTLTGAWETSSPIKDALEQDVEIETIILKDVVSLGKAVFANTGFKNLIIFSSTRPTFAVDNVETTATNVVGTLFGVNGGAGGGTINVYYQSDETLKEYCGYTGTLTCAEGLGLSGANENFSASNNGTLDEHKFINVAEDLSCEFGYKTVTTSPLFTFENVPTNIFKITSESVVLSQDASTTGITYSINRDNEVYISTKATSEVGTYSITSKLEVTSLFTGDSFIIQTVGSFEIEKREWNIYIYDLDLTLGETETLNPTVTTLSSLNETPSSISYSVHSSPTNSTFTVNSSTGAITTGTVAGTAVVKITVAGNAHHNETNYYVTITLNKATPSYDFDEDFSDAEDYFTIPSLTYNGEAQTLLTYTGTVTGGTLKYRVGEEGSWGTNPQATDADTYDVYVYIVGSDGYNDVGSEESPIGSLSVTISPLEITENPFSVSGTYTYTAEAQTPTLTGGSYTLDTDYSIEFADGTDHTSAGEDIAFTVSFINNYSGDFDMTFDIATVTLTPSISGTYTKSYDTTTYINNDEEDLSISLTGVISADSSNVSASATSYAFETATVGTSKKIIAYTITLSGTAAANYTLSVTQLDATVGEIEDADLDDFTIAIDDADFTDDATTYTGSVITPSITVTGTDVMGNEITLTETTHYTVAYSNNTNAAESNDASAPTITITAVASSGFINGNTYTFTINPLDITDQATLELNNSLTYTGLEQTQTVKSFTVNGLTVTFEYEDNKETDVNTDGDYTLTVNGTGNFCGSLTIDWNISPMEITGWSGGQLVSPSASSLTYKVEDGEIVSQIPTFTLATSAGTLVEDTDYSVALKTGSDGYYGANTCVITFEGNYSGSFDYDYTIAPKKVSISSNGSKEYLTADDSSDYFTVTGLFSSVDDVEDVFTSTLTRAAGEDVGSYAFSSGAVTVNATYADRYTIETTDYTTNFTITARAITFENIIMPSNLLYNGQEKAIGIKVTNSSVSPEVEYTLLTPTDYTVVYTNQNGNSGNIDAGAITAKITYSTNFTGITIVTYYIQPKAVKIVGVTAGNKVYDKLLSVDADNTNAHFEIDAIVEADEDYVEIDLTNAQANFADKNAGTNKSVFFTGYALKGTKAHNYYLVAQPESVLADITPVMVTVTLSATNREFDETKIVAVTGVVEGVLSDETVTAVIPNNIGFMADANVGNNKVVTAKYISLTGTDAKNYALSPANTTATCNVNITPKTMNFVANDITLSATTYNYSNTENKPTIELFDGETKLVEDVDYTLTYHNNINAGTASVDIELIGNYKNTPAVLTKYFTINKINYDLTGIRFDTFEIKTTDENVTFPLKGSLPTGLDGVQLQVTFNVYNSEGQLVNQPFERGFYVVDAVFSTSSINYVTPNKLSTVMQVKWVYDSKLPQIESDNDVVIVTSEQGINPNYVLTVKVETEDDGEVYTNSVDKVKNHEEFGRMDKVVVVYDVSLMNEGQAVQPNGEITVCIAVPQKLANKEFKLYHVHNNQAELLDYELREGYAIVKLSGLSEFVFVDCSAECITHYFAIAAFVIFLAFFIVWWIVLKHRNYVYKNNFNVLTVDWVAILASSAYLVANIFISIYAFCTLCDVFAVLNWCLFLITTIAWLNLVIMKVLEYLAKFFVMLGRCILRLLGIKLEIKERESLLKNPLKNYTLNECLKMLSNEKFDSCVTKESIAEYLKYSYHNQVAVRMRENYTKNNTPLADTCYTNMVLNKGKLEIAPKRECFAFVYQTNDKKVMLIVKADDKIIKNIRKVHPLVTKCSFPKAKEYTEDWYSVAIDNTWTEQQVYQLLDEVKDLSERQ